MHSAAGAGCGARADGARPPARKPAHAPAGHGEAGPCRAAPLLRGEWPGRELLSHRAPAPARERPLVLFRSRLTLLVGSGPAALALAPVRALPVAPAAVGVVLHEDASAG